MPDATVSALLDADERSRAARTTTGGELLVADRPILGISSRTYRVREPGAGDRGIAATAPAHRPPVVTRDRTHLRRVPARLASHAG